MAKISQEVIARVPGLSAAQRNGDISFINLDTDDTSPKKTAGFTDDQIKTMDISMLSGELAKINDEEQNIIALQMDLAKRRQNLHELIARKQEIK